MSQSFGDIPLFRELQRILASSGQGPVNFEIARQIAGTIATQTPDPKPAPETATIIAGGIRDAELLLGGYTRLDLDEPLRSTTMGRATWVLAALEGWRWLLEALARRFTGELSNLAAGSSETQDPLGQMMGQVAPLLLGIQTGSVIGHLANDALGRHDPPIPLEDDGALFFVTSNIERVADQYDFDLDLLLRWLALHEAARQLIVLSRPWVPRYLRGLLLSLVEAIEIDTGDLERRLADLQTGGMEALQSGARLDQMLPVVQTERYSHALGALRSFLAILEGYSEHAAGAVKDSLLGETARIDEGMARHRSAVSQGQAMLASVLGVERDRELEAAGRTFCAAVAQLKGMAALNEVWAAGDNLPNLAEIKDPFAWMERVVPQEPDD